MSFAGVSQDNYTYENTGRLQSIQLNFPYLGPVSSSQIGLNYNYSLTGRIGEVDQNTTFTYMGTPTTEQKKYTYTYDRLWRLASETLQHYQDPYWYTDWSNSWSYDRYGNLTGTANEATNRLTAYLSHYDAAGNLLQDSSNNYAYDARNLLKQANRQTDNNVLGTYRYDALGRRVSLLSGIAGVRSRPLHSARFDEERDVGPSFFCFSTTWMMRKFRAYPPIVYSLHSQFSPPASPPGASGRARRGSGFFRCPTCGWARYDYKLAT